MTDDKTPTYYVLGWRFDVLLEADSFIHVATVREQPRIVTFGSTPSDAFAQLREELAERVGAAVAPGEKVNWPAAPG